MTPFRINIGIVLILFLLLVSANNELNGMNMLTPEGETYALIIGVSDYSDQQISDLQYSDDDAMAFYNYLVGPAGGRVDSNNIRLLLQDKATVASVYNSMKYFKDKLRKGDKFFIYFAGHGDAESSIYNLGYLLTYDTPFRNYLNNAIRIEDFNDLATTLSVLKGVEVVVITDACKSGSLIGVDNSHKHTLVQEQLAKAKEGEIRFASCEPGQLSQENSSWGGGRGVFSFYFVKGLQGAADANNDNRITVQEIGAYVKGNVRDEIDDLLLDEQIPVADGISDKVVAIIPDGFEPNDLPPSGHGPSNDTITQGRARSVSGIGESVPQRFVRHLKKAGYFTTVDLKEILTLSGDEYLNILIEDKRLLVIPPDEENHEEKVIDNSRYLDMVLESNELQQELKNEIAVEYHNNVQEIINAYLDGDEAELEERRYYNINKQGYVKYLEMLEIAEKLLEPDHPLLQIIEVKKYYLRGVIARLQLSITQNIDSVLNIAYKAQLKAVELSPKAAYVHNELGVVYIYMDDIQNGIKHFHKAIEASQNWAIPYANLAYVNMKEGDIEKAKKLVFKADSLHTNLHLTKTNIGLIYNKDHNYLFAEEYFNKAIKINNRHYLPFDGLGEVYMNLTQYEKSDSFYYEAAIRKLNTNFATASPHHLNFQSLAPTYGMLECEIDTTKINRDDVITLFVWGLKHFDKNNYKQAIKIWQKVIDANHNNPLVFYYTGMAYFKIRKWKESELMFNYSLGYYLETEDFEMHLADWQDKVKNQPNPDCLIEKYRFSQYPQYVTFFFLGKLYNNWQYFEKSLLAYEEILALFDPSEQTFKIACLLKLDILQKLKQWETAELFIENNFTNQEDFYTLEKNVFYDNAIHDNPSDGYWYFKKGLHLKQYAENSEREGLIDTILYHPGDKKEFFVDKSHYYTSVYIREAFNPNQVFNKTLPSLDKRFFGDGIRSAKVPGTGEYVSFENWILNPKRDAIEAFKSALKLYFDKDMTADIRYKIGELYVAAGSHTLAFPYFNEAVDDKPNRATYRLKAIESGTSIYENRIVYDHLLHMNEDTTINHSASMQLAHFSAYKGDYDLSNQTIDRIRAYFPYPSPELRELEALLMVLKDEYDSAIKAYKNLEDSPSRTHEKYYTIARLYAMKGDHRNAKKWLEKSIDAGFYFPFVLDAEPLWYDIFGENGWREKYQLKAAPKPYKDAHLVSDSYY